MSRRSFALLSTCLLVVVHFQLVRGGLQCAQCSGEEGCVSARDVIRCKPGHFCYTLTNVNTRKDEEKGCAGNCDFAETQQQLCFACHDDLCNQKGPLRCGYCDGEVDCDGSTRVVSCPPSLPGCYTIRNGTTGVVTRKGCSEGCMKSRDGTCQFCQEDLCNHLMKRREPSEINE